MKLLLVLFFTALLFFVNTDSVQYGRFISIKEAPYYVLLFEPGICGGVIISEYWIITAGHCISDFPASGVLTGNDIYNKEDEDVAKVHRSVHWLDKIMVHGDYDLAKNLPINDIALLKLREPIQSDEYRQPIKIRRSPPRENETVVVVGLGLQGDAKDFTPVLKQTEVTVVNETNCDFHYVTSSIRNIAFCAGNGTTDQCKGDSGGPAVIDGQLAGIVSFGFPCRSYEDNARMPGKYTRVDAFYDWILETTGIVY